MGDKYIFGSHTISLSDIVWLQATLPVNKGGLGIRSVQSPASSAFLASAESMASLRQIILGRFTLDVYSYVSQAPAIWSLKSSSCWSPSFFTNVLGSSFD